MSVISQHTHIHSLYDVNVKVGGRIKKVNKKADRQQHRRPPLFCLEFPEAVTKRRSLPPPHRFCASHNDSENAAATAHTLSFPVFLSKFRFCFPTSVYVYRVENVTRFVCQFNEMR